MKKIFVEKYLVLYRYNNRIKAKIYRCHNANEADEKFRSSQIFKHMVREDGDRYEIYVFTGVEDYV